jgi:hypothetical protein
MAKTVSVEALQSLIEELTKDRPNQARVKKGMFENGLEYTADPIQQMSVVLALMSQVSPDIRKAKLKEKVTEL